MIYVILYIKVPSVKISGSMGMFTEWHVEPKDVWSAQPGGCGDIAHTWFFETSSRGIQTMQSEKLESMNNRTPPCPWSLGPRLWCISWTRRWSFSFQACQARWISCFLCFLQRGLKRQARGNRGDISQVSVLILLGMVLNRLDGHELLRTI